MNSRRMDQFTWDISTGQLQELTGQEIERVRQFHNQLVRDGDRMTLSEIIQRLSKMYLDFETFNCHIGFLQHVSTDPAVREASSNCDEQLSALMVDMGLRKDVYGVIKGCYDEQSERSLRYDRNTQQLEPEDQRFIKRVLLEYRRDGLDLSDEQLEELKNIKKEMNQLSIAFQRNLGEENTVLEFSREELDGLSDEFLGNLERTDNDKYKVDLKYATYIPAIKKVHNREVRAALERAFNSRCKDENSKLLHQLVQLRRKHAEILGYQTHTEYTVEPLMAREQGKIHQFLKDLHQKMQPLYRQDMDQLMDQMGGSEVGMHDYQYYMREVEKNQHNIDQDEVKNYFPMEAVTENLLAIYQELLSLRFEQVDVPTWHPEVVAYQVTDLDDGMYLGTFYLDLYPREGKYGHAAVFGLTPSSSLFNSRPEAAMVCNFTKPTKMMPSLLRHNEVVTYFHEFGHVMHQICSRTRHSYFSGTSVERDFVEAPSQMLENWCWQREALQRLSSHYLTQEPLPDDLIQKLCQLQHFMPGLFTVRQIMLASFDQFIHSQPQNMSEEQVQQAWVNLQRSIMSCEVEDSERSYVIHPSPGTYMPASFGHLGGGYDARYYGYLWSDVYSKDMFYTMFQNHLFDPEVGRQYKNKILAKGGSEDAMDLLTDFLDRPPNSDAFFQALLNNEL